MGFQNLGVFNGDSYGLNYLSPNYRIIKIYVKKIRYFQIKKKKNKHTQGRGVQIWDSYILKSYTAKLCEQKLTGFIRKFEFLQISH